MVETTAPAVSTDAAISSSCGTALPPAMARAAAAVEFALDQAEKALQNDIDDFAAGWVSIAATIAWNAPPGFLFSARADAILLTLSGHVRACELPAVPGNATPGHARGRRYLHVLSVAHGVGGHTRVAARWILAAAGCEPADRHSGVLVNQGTNAIPPWLSEAVAAGRGELFQLQPDNSPLAQARELASLSAALADIVILHIHPNDPIPWIAYAERPAGLTVLAFNHADHLFSLGLRFADVVAEFRPSGRDLSLQARGIDPAQQALVPLPLSDPYPEHNWGPEHRRAEVRASARGRLGIGEDTRVALTIGSPYKYTAALGLDFRRAAQTILLASPESILIAVGLDNVGPWRALHESTGGRFRPVGRIFDPELLQRYYAAADVYFEGFPFGSLTAMLDAALVMLPVLRLRNPAAPILSGDDVALDGLAVDAGDETGYIAAAVSLLARSPVELGDLGINLRRRVVTEHLGDAWCSRWLQPAVRQAVDIATRKPTSYSTATADQANEIAPLAATTRDAIYLMRSATDGKDLILRSLLDHDFVLPRTIRITLLIYAARRGEGLLTPRGWIRLLANIALLILGHRASNSVTRTLIPKAMRRWLAFHGMTPRGGR